MNKIFYYSERIIGDESDNLIIYFAGPIEISICGWNEEIKLSTKEKWSYLLEECFEVAKEAWEIEDNQVLIKKKEEIIIKFNFKNIKLYIEHNIIFM